MNRSALIPLSVAMPSPHLVRWLVRSFAATVVLALAGCTTTDVGKCEGDVALELVPATAGWDVLVRPRQGAEQRLPLVDRDALRAVLRPIAEATPPHPSEPRCREGLVTIHASARLPFAEVGWLLGAVGSEGLFHIALTLPGRPPCDVTLPINRLMKGQGHELGVEITTKVVDAVRDYAVVTDPFPFVPFEDQDVAASPSPVHGNQESRVCGLSSLREAVEHWRRIHAMECDGPPVILGTDATVLEVVQVVEVLRSVGFDQVSFAAAWEDHATGRRGPR